MGKTVAKKEAGEIISYEEFVGNTGLENAEADDYAVPFVYPVQKNSNIIDTNENARPGMLLNSVTGSLYTELICIPCEFEKEYVEWVPLDNGGGFVGRHDWDSGIIDQATQGDDGKYYLPNGNQVVDTRKHYVICISPDTGEIFPAIIAMTSTQCKKSRRWLSTMANQKVDLSDGRKITPPTFAYSYRIGTVKETKDSYSWYGYTIQTEEQIQDASLFQQARELNESIRKGEVQDSTPQPQ